MISVILKWRLKCPRNFRPPPLDITHHLTEHTVTDPFYKFYRLSAARNIILFWSHVFSPCASNLKTGGSRWVGVVGGVVGGGRDEGRGSPKRVGDGPES